MKRLLSRRTALTAAAALPVANLLPRAAGADGPWKPSQGIRFPAHGTPAAFDTFAKGQITLWKGVIDKEGLQLDVN